MNDCFICKKHLGLINTSGISIFEDEHVYVGHIDKQDAPNYLGHIMIDLKRHTPSLGDMSIDEASTFGVTIAKVSKALIECEKAEHIYSYVLGDAVPHLHMHIIARYPNTPKKYWGPQAVYDWENAPFGNEKDVEDLCMRLKTYLEKSS